ncbi:BRO1-domain-containing protein [Rozella allomycis CSF55]|uniref:BRO domain-containing protein 1 n=1 Tax=Rozella allomycis (strain CSF55) TaxID=988480 RepID=A0A4P9YEP2_ROZAC|nr:BRO1-domain-containing protein [Rozella allomycis CSF55]
MKSFRYYGQLTEIEKKFKFGQDNIKVMFTWTSSSMSLEYEKACTLFNAAVAHCLVGEREPKTDSESIKRACNSFLIASGIFQYVREKHLNTEAPNSEVNDVNLNILTMVYQAKAQECYVLKGMQDKMKDGLLAKIAARTGEMYELCYETVKASDPKRSVFGKQFGPNLFGNGCKYLVMAMMKKANDAKTQGEYGEVVTRLKVALEITKNALVESKYMDANLVSELKNFESVLKKEISLSEKDNDVIYHMPVPNEATLQSIQRVELAKPTLFLVSNFSEIIGTPLFSTLIPFSIHHSLTLYISQRESIVSPLIRQCDDQITIGSITISDFSETQKLQAVEIPANVLNKMKSIVKNGGLLALESSMKTIDEMKNATSQTLSQISLKFENNQIKAKFQKHFQHYSELTSKASASDEIVKNLFNNIKQGIDILSKENVLLERFKSFHPSPTLADGELIGNLSFLVDSLKAIKQNIESLANDDNQNPSIVIDHEIKKYDEFPNKINENILAQNKIIQEIHQKGLGSGKVKEKDEFIAYLDNVYIEYEKLCSFVDEAIKFYADIQKPISNLEKEIESFSNSIPSTQTTWNSAMPANYSSSTGTGSPFTTSGYQMFPPQQQPYQSGPYAPAPYQQPYQQQPRPNYNYAQSNPYPPNYNQQPAFNPYQQNQIPPQFQGQASQGYQYQNAPYNPYSNAPK